ncbi:MAG: TatD family hydrolase [Candidatus Thorarchaeota archaeon]|nr:MAG: TatD family hydrolase [Candidatus Thorarchaeota archaeon]
MFIDCHAHIVHPFNFTTITQDDVEEVIAAAREREVHHIVSVSSNPDYFTFYDIEKCFENLIRVVGIQRGLAQDEHSTMLSSLKEQIELTKPKAIGEIGLDYTSLDLESAKGEAVRKRQQKLFRKQILMAREFDLPVVIHAAEADRDLLGILEEQHAEEIGGMIHGCSCGRETRERLLDMGFLLSFGPSQLERPETLEMVKQTPAEHLLTETDAPAWLRFPDTSVEFQPADVSEVAGKLARMKGMELGDFANAVLKSATSLFNL